MSDDLTITLRGQEAYDYLRWRAERYKERETQELKERAAEAKDNIQRKLTQKEEEMWSLISTNCPACNHYRGDTYITCTQGRLQMQGKPCMAFEPKETSSSPF